MWKFNNLNTLLITKTMFLYLKYPLQRLLVLLLDSKALHMAKWFIWFIVRNSALVFIVVPQKFIFLTLNLKKNSISILSDYDKKQEVQNFSHLRKIQKVALCSFINNFGPPRG